jgi:hypothetical protein
VLKAQEKCRVTHSYYFQMVGVGALVKLSYRQFMYPVSENLHVFGVLERIFFGVK